VINYNAFKKNSAIQSTGSSQQQTTNHAVQIDRNSPNQQPWQTDMSTALMYEQKLMDHRLRTLETHMNQRHAYITITAYSISDTVAITTSKTMSVFNRNKAIPQ